MTVVVWTVVVVPPDPGVVGELPQPAAARTKEDDPVPCKPVTHTIPTEGDQDPPGRVTLTEVRRARQAIRPGAVRPGVRPGVSGPGAVGPERRATLPAGRT